MDMDLLVKYGLTDTLPQLVTDDAPAGLARIVTTAKEVLAKVKAPKASDDAPKVDGKYVAASKADNAARLDAEDFLHSVAVSALEKFADRPEVWYWLRQSDTLSEVLKSEVEWNAYNFDRSAPKPETSDDERAILADDYRALKVLASDYLRMVANATDRKYPTGTVKFEGSKVVPDLEALKGNYGATDGTVATGKYAKAWSVTYIVDGVEYTDPKEAIRYIYPGTNRVGVTTGDLHKMIDGEPWERINKGERITFPEYGGRVEFTVYRKSAESAE